MRYYISLFQKVCDIYKNINNQKSERFLICPSLRIYSIDELKLLLPNFKIENSALPNSILMKQDIAMQFNSIPSSDKYWDINPNNVLHEKYRSIVNYPQEIKFEEVEPELKESNEILFENGKDSKLFSKYKKLYSIVRIKIDDIEEILKSRPVNDSLEFNLWNEKLEFLIKEKEIAIANLVSIGQKVKIDNALRVLNKASSFDTFLFLLNRAKENLKISEQTSITSLMSYHDISFIPHDFMTNENEWVDLNLNKVELESLYQKAKLEGMIPNELLSIDYDEKVIQSIELQYAVVSMTRSWFDIEPIVSEYYKFDPSIEVSNGKDISNTYFMPAFSKKLIIVKNIKINIGVSELSDDGLIKFGPWILKNKSNKIGNSNYLTPLKDQASIGYKIKQYSNIKSKSLDARNGLKSNPIKFPIGTLPVHILHASMVTPANNNTPTPKGTLQISLVDKLNNNPIVDADLVLKGSNNIIIELETNDNGLLNTKLVVGDYKIEIRKSGYEILKTNAIITKDSNTNLKLVLSPKDVFFDSYFLLGAICEILPPIGKGAIS